MKLWDERGECIPGFGPFPGIHAIRRNNILIGVLRPPVSVLFNL